MHWHALQVLLDYFYKLNLTNKLLLRESPIFSLFWQEKFTFGGAPSRVHEWWLSTVCEVWEESGLRRIGSRRDTETFTGKPGGQPRGRSIRHRLLQSLMCHEEVETHPCSLPFFPSGMLLELTLIKPRFKINFFWWLSISEKVKESRSSSEIGTLMKARKFIS